MSGGALDQVDLLCDDFSVGNLLDAFVNDVNEVNEVNEVIEIDKLNELNEIDKLKEKIKEQEGKIKEINKLGRVTGGIPKKTEATVVVPGSSKAVKRKCLGEGKKMAFTGHACSQYYLYLREQGGTGTWACKFQARHVQADNEVFAIVHFVAGDEALFEAYVEQEMNGENGIAGAMAWAEKKKKKKRPSNQTVTASGRNSDSSDRDGSGDGSSGGSSSGGSGGGTSDDGSGSDNTGSGDTTETGEGANNNGGDQQSAAKRARHHRGVDELSNAVNSLTLADGNDGDDAGDRSVNGDDAGNDGVDGDDPGDDVSNADIVAKPTKERPVRPTTSTAALTRWLQLRGSQGRVADWKGASATCSKYATVRATERGFVATLRVTVDGVERTAQSGAQSTEGGAVEEAAAGLLGAGELEGWLGMAQTGSVWAAGPVLSKL